MYFTPRGYTREVDNLDIRVGTAVVGLDVGDAEDGADEGPSVGTCLRVTQLQL